MGSVYVIEPVVSSDESAAIHKSIQDCCDPVNGGKHLLP